MPSPRPKQLPPRRDPVRRRGIPTGDKTRLLNVDPAKKYKFVDPSDRLNGVGQHEQHGWVIEKKSKDGIALHAGTTAKNAGDPLTLYDHVLMSIDRAEWDRIELEGQDGDGGQLALDDIDAQIIDPSGLAEAGLRSRYAEVKNETRPSEDFTVSA